METMETVKGSYFINTYKGIVTNFDKGNVTCYLYEVKEYRKFEVKPLFEGLKLYKGKNILIVIESKPGTIITTCIESNDFKLVQICKYFAKVNPIKNLIQQLSMNIKLSIK